MVLSELRLLMAMVLVALVGLSGCASVHGPDPLEGINRKVFSLNERLDRSVMQPVATAYAAAVPSPARDAVRNFFENPRDLWSAANLLLQGRPGEAASNVMRFAVNSVFGLAGLIDIASPAGLAKHRADFGQSLGVWGVPSGPYIVWPLLGPSTVRDSPDILADAKFSAQRVVAGGGLRTPLTALQAVSTRADLLAVTRMLGEVSLDKYLFVRDAYLQRRQYLVQDAMTTSEQPPEQ